MARPTCEKCRKGFHKCRGYDEPCIFVHTHVQPADKSPKPAPRKTSQLSISPKSDVISPTPNSSPSPSPWPGQDVAVRDSHIVPAAMSMIAFADEIVIAHLMSQMAMSPRDIPSSSSTITNPSPQDLVLTSHRQPTPPAAYISALSVAKALFGRINNQQQMMRDATQLYGQALQCLRDNIESLPSGEDTNTDSGRPLESLWSSLFLGMYEMISTSGSADWLQHSLGVAALVSLKYTHDFETCVGITDMVEDSACWTTCFSGRARTSVAGS